MDVKTVSQNPIHIDPRRQAGIEFLVHAADLLRFFRCNAFFFFQKLYQSLPRDIFFRHEKIFIHPHFQPRLGGIQFQFSVPNPDVIQFIQDGILGVQQRIFRQHIFTEQIRTLACHATNEALRRFFLIHHFRKIPRQNAPVFLADGPCFSESLRVRIGRPHIIRHAEFQNLYHLIRDRPIVVPRIQKRQIGFRFFQNLNHFDFVQLIGDDAIVGRHGFRQKRPQIHFLQNIIFIGRIRQFFQFLLDFFIKLLRRDRFLYRKLLFLSGRRMLHVRRIARLSRAFENVIVRRHVLLQDRLQNFQIFFMLFVNSNFRIGQETAVSQKLDQPGPIIKLLTRRNQAVALLGKTAFQLRVSLLICRRRKGNLIVVRVFQLFVRKEFIRFPFQPAKQIGRRFDLIFLFLITDRKYRLQLFGLIFPRLLPIGKERLDIRLIFL